jgi:hypothetical protein
VRERVSRPCTGTPTKKSPTHTLSLSLSLTHTHTHSLFLSLADRGAATGGGGLCGAGRVGKAVLAFTPNPQPCTINPAPSTLHPQPCTLNPQKHLCGTNLGGDSVGLSPLPFASPGRERELQSQNFASEIVWWYTKNMTPRSKSSTFGVFLSLSRVRIDVHRTWPGRASN